LFSNRTSNRSRAETVIEKSAARVEIHEINGAVTRGPARALRVTLEEMEMEIWGQIRE
jgi:hypothetical protein